jgi:ferric-dicitrate binding protein FerR (iron transport regulator)
MKKILFVIALCSHFFVHGAGTLIYLKGKVRVSGKKAKLHQIINNGQQVVTGNNSLAIIELANGSKVKLEKNSKLTIKKTSKKAVRVDLASGQVFFNVVKSKLKSNRSSFVVKAGTVAMGVRGTEFFVALSSHGKKKNKKRDVWMCVKEGLVAIKGTKDKKVVLVKEGEGVVSGVSGTTSKPKPLAWTKKLNWNMDAKTGEVVNKVSIEEAYSDLLDQDYD